jgi:UDP-glucose 4-epimerase
MRVMMTGGTGFIGSWIAEALLSAGHEVTLLARNPEKVAGQQHRAGLAFVEGSLRDTEAIRAAMRGQDACVHVALGWGDTAADMAREDTIPSIEIFQAAIDADVRDVIFTSSIAVFGDRRQLYTDDTALRPDRYYGATKAATEAYLLAAAREAGIRGNIVRPGYTFGGPAVPGASIYTDTKLSDMAANALRGRPIDVRKNDGTQFIAVADLAQVYLSILESDVDRGVYTAVSRNFTTWESCARSIVEITGSSSDIVVEPTNLDPSQGRNDVSTIRDSFGLEFDSSAALDTHLQYVVAVAESRLNAPSTL